MKRKIDLGKIIIISTVLSSITVQNLKAQSIKTIPFPNAQISVFGIGGVIYNNNLYGTCAGFSSQQLTQLAYFDGNSITPIPNPDANSQLAGMFGILNNKLGLTYYRNLNGSSPATIDLATYDGNNLNFFSPPTTYSLPLPTGRIFNNNFFFNSISASSPIYSTGRFDGNSFTNVPLPLNTYVAFPTPLFKPFNGNLFLNYLNSPGIFQMAVYNGNGYTPIPNPGAGSVFSLGQYDSTMYIGYNTLNSVTQLGIFDGNAYALVSNPDATGSLSGFVNVYNNKAYFNYKENGVYTLAQYNGISLIPIRNPDNSTDSTATPNSPSIVYNEKLYFQYLNASGVHQLAQFDGNTIKLIRNPDNGIGGIFSPIIFNDKLFFGYTNASYINQLAEFDGDTITLIPNPDNNLTDSLIGYQGYDPIVFKNKLYFNYMNESGAGQLAYLDETETIPPNNVLPAKPATEYASYEYTDTAGWTNYYYDNNTPNDFTDDTLLLSLKKNGQNIGSVGDGAFTVKLVATTDAGSNTGIKVTSPIITNTSGFWAMNRYWQVTTTLEPSASVGVRFYYNNQDLKDLNGSYPSHSVANNQLIFYKADGGNPDPTSHLAGVTKLISLLPASYASDSTWTYHAFNDTAQYAEFSVSSFSGGGGGATGNNLSLPVTLLNFFAQLKNNNALLTWQTATEENSNYFNIQRSTDGLHFNNIGKVSAAGTSSVIKNYNYTDINAASLSTVTIYYRLQEIDKDANSSYSKIQSIILNKNKVLITVTPNPVNNFINIISSACLKNAKINLIGIGGGRYYSTVQNLTAGGQIQIPATKLAKGTYIVTVENNEVKQQVAIIK